VLQFHVDNWV